MNQIEIIQINESDFERILRSNKGFVLFGFINPESGWCTIMLKQVQKFIRECDIKIIHYAINLHNAPVLSQKFYIEEIPKYLLYKNQKLIFTFEGLKSHDELSELLFEICKNNI